MRFSMAAEVFSMALHSLRSHKLRSFLTVAGIIIGITAVVGMSGLLRGLDESFKSQLLALDANVFFVARIGGRLVGHDEYLKLLRRPKFTRPDAAAIVRACPEVAEVSVMVEHGPDGPTSARLSYGGRDTEDTMLAGVSSNHLKVIHIGIAQGRFFNEAEDRANQRVVVIGDGPAKGLFPGVSPVGKTVRISGTAFHVVGVLEKRKELPGASDLDDFALIPAGTYERQWKTAETSLQLGILPAEGHAPAEVQEAVVQFLRRHRNLKVTEDNDFDVMNQDTLMDLWKKLTQTIVLALTSLSSVALLVGGIGVMAVMLVTVTERTCEIGVRKAIGARRRDILLQFLAEAAVLTTLGGLSGVAVGGLLGHALTYLTNLPVSFPLWAYGLSLAVSTAIGMVFGVYPAWRAAAMDPVEALRYGKA